MKPIKQVIVDYIESKHPVVPVGYDQPEPHISSGGFNAGSLIFCPRKDYYQRAEKNGLLPFTPEPRTAASRWKMRLGVIVETLVVYPALQSSGEWERVDTQYKLTHEPTERSTVVDFVLENTGERTYMELKTAESKFVLKGDKPTMHLVQPIWAWVCEPEGSKPDNLLLVQMAYDRFPIFNEYHINLERLMYTSRGQSWPLPDEVAPVRLLAEATRRYEMYHARELPPTEPFAKWECRYCDYKEACKVNTNILDKTEVEDE